MRSTVTVGWCIGAVLVMAGVAWANSAPVVSSVTVGQRADASRLVDIHYNLADADGDTCTVWVSISDNGGATWQVPAISFVGHVGAGIPPGTNKTIVWDAGADMPGKVGNFKVRVWADDGNGPAPKVLVPGGYFPYQNTNPPIFIDTFLIDKYEVTNAFYVQFLNNADPTSVHYTTLNTEINRTGSSGNYYYLVFPGKETYPVKYVSYDDAVAFAAWRSALEGVNWRLPTEQEWEKAAAWDPVQQHFYTYGFHQDSTINCLWCNYYTGTAYCFGNTTPVGYFNGTGGRNDAKSYYGCYDMSGNLLEWTGSWYAVNQYRVVRGGDWSDNAILCQSLLRNYYTFPPSYRNNILGFRLLLDLH